MEAQLLHNIFLSINISECIPLKTIKHMNSIIARIQILWLSVQVRIQERARARHGIFAQMQKGIKRTYRPGVTHRKMQKGDHRDRSFRLVSRGTRVQIRPRKVHRNGTCILTSGKLLFPWPVYINIRLSRA